MVFSERYKDLIDVGDGEPKDFICGEITFAEIPTIITRPLAKLAINLSATMNTYLIEEYAAIMNTFETTKTTEEESDRVPF